MAVLLASLSWLAASAAPGAVELWGRQDEFVRIEPQDDPDAPLNEHPVKLPPGRITAMLSALQVRFADQAEPMPLFSRQEVAVLAPALAEGLARAEPRQDVTFATIGSHRINSVVGRLLVNTGRLFYRDGTLNILFGEVHGEFRKRNVYGKRDEDYRPRRHASRTTPAKGGWRLEAEGVARRREDGRERGDWLLIEVARFSAAADAPAAAAIGDAVSQSRGAATVAQSRTIEERLAELKQLREQELIPEDLYAARVREIIDSDAAPATASVEERLRALKGLRQEGLIPEDAYQAALESIVDEL